MLPMRTTPPFRADHVGSLLRPASVLAARDDFAAGRIAADQLRAVEDKAIADVVAMQQNVGLQTATDGEARRNSPSVAVCRPTFCCMATTSAMALSSTALSWSAAIRPAAKSSRAASTDAGRSRLPTWSARKGGVVRMGNIVALSARTGQSAPGG